MNTEPDSRIGNLTMPVPEVCIRTKVRRKKDSLLLNRGSFLRMQKSGYRRSQKPILESGSVYYFIDGYNLLFTTSDSIKNLQIQRQTLVAWIQREFAKLRLEGSVVFDGAHRRGEESGLSYPSPLEVAYTPKGQSADEYIIEQLSLQKNCKTSVVITNDLGLRRHAQATGARTQSNESFLQWLAKKGKKKGTKEKVVKETDQQINRLMKIFEERLKKKSTDDLEGWE